MTEKEEISKLLEELRQLLQKKYGQNNGIASYAGIVTGILLGSFHDFKILKLMIEQEIWDHKNIDFNFPKQL